MKWFVVASFALCACHSHKQPEDSDFAGLFGNDDFSATVPADAGVHDAGVIAKIDAAGVACDPVVPLDGGDPTGDWTFVGGCAAPDSFYELIGTCPSMTIDSLAVTGQAAASAPSGELELRANSAYVRHLSARLTGHATIPSACLPQANDCEGYVMTVKQQFGWLDISCTTACSCTIGTDVTFAETGTWTNENGGYTLTSSEGAIEHFYANSDTIGGQHTLRERGDDSAQRGDRSVTFVLYDTN